MLRSIFRAVARLAFVAAIAAPLQAAGPGTGNDFAGKRVLVIGIDGLRPDALQRVMADGLAPSLKGLADMGTVCWNAYAGGEQGTVTEQPTISGPGWTSIFTGVWMNRHQVKDNGTLPYNQPGTPGSYLAKDAPHFAVRLKAAKPNASVCSFASWDWIASYLVAAQSSAFDVNERGVGVNYAGRDLDVKNKTLACLKDSNPDVLLVHFDQVDGAGHATGFSQDNPIYTNAIHQVDKHVAELMAGIRQRPQAADEKWLVLVTTDHGGLEKAHGGQTPEERTIFVIASGPGIPAGQVSTTPVGHVVIAPTVFHYFGIPIDPAWGWAGKPFGSVVNARE